MEIPKNFFLCILILIVLLSVVNTVDCKDVRIAFWVNQFNLRGTSWAVYDYADCNETILGNHSIIIANTEYNSKPEYSDEMKRFFLARFPGRCYECTPNGIDTIIKNEHIDIFYALKSGAPDGIVSQVCKNAIHSVFTVRPHGDICAPISRWLSFLKYKQHSLPYVPHMIRMADTKETLHKELGIPDGSVVFGGYGGNGSFNIMYAQQVVIETAKRHPNWYFIFLNFNRFCSLPNVKFLPGTSDMVYKTKFVNTCDAMLHARNNGETFGLSCGEFSIRNKAVITQNLPYNSGVAGDLAHIDILGDKGLYYTNKQDLSDLLEYCGNNINSIRAGDWDAYSKEYNPTEVMKKFNEIFIQPLIKK